MTSIVVGAYGVPFFGAHPFSLLPLWGSPPPLTDGPELGGSSRAAQHHEGMIYEWRVSAWEGSKGLILWVPYPNIELGVYLKTVSRWSA